MLSKQLINEYIDIAREESGEELSVSQANLEANNLVQFCNLLIEIEKENNQKLTPKKNSGSELS